MTERHAMEATFYDQRIRSAPPPDDRYDPLYVAAFGLIDAGRSIVELGCGTGRFARYMLGHASTYLGLDFSLAAVEEARRYNESPAAFDVADLRTDPIPIADVYVALEVLEHLADDLALLARLPAGARVVLSVPSFDSPAHVRHFPTRGAAAARYGRALSIDRADVVWIRRGVWFELLAGTVR